MAKHKSKYRYNVILCGHTEKEHYARGMCRGCYEKFKYRAKKFGTESLKKVEVAQHIANAVITSGLDVEAAVKKVLPEIANVPGEVRKFKEEIEQSPEVQNAIQEGLVDCGLDDASKQEYVRTLWMWLKMGSEKQKIAAAQILGRGFIGEKVDDKRPIELKIEGFSAGMSRMLGNDAAGQGALPPEDVRAIDDEPEEEEVIH